MSYYNVVEVEAAIVSLQAAYPTLCTLITLPNCTAEFRISRALKISQDPGAGRPCVMLTSGVHGREWGGCEIVIAFAADLLLAYSSETGIAYGGKSFSGFSVKAIVESLDILIFPLVNPDGRFFSQTHDQHNPVGWRKNRNPASSSGDGTKIGVDINRNFGFLWNFTDSMVPANVDTSIDPAKPTFRGEGPFSEPETRNVKWLLDTTPLTRWLVDVHSFSGAILYGWGDDENQPCDAKKNFANPLWDGKRGAKGDNYAEFRPSLDSSLELALAGRMAAAIKAVAQNLYTPQQSFGNKAVSGAVDDYVYSRQFESPSKPKIQGFVIEFGDTAFHPVWPAMEEIIADISAALFEFCVAVTPPSLVPAPA